MAVIRVGVQDKFTGVVAEGETGHGGFAAEKLEFQDVFVVGDGARQGGDTEDDAVDV